jgi:hypothetical protein
MKITIVLVIIGVLVSIVSVGAQTIVPSSGVRQEEQLYEAVPPGDRESLRHSVEKFVALRKAGGWDELYGMWKNEKHETKAGFLDRMQHSSRLGKFTLVEITYFPPANAWVFSGCAEFDPPPDQIPSVYSKLSAYRSQDAWFFSDVAVALVDEAGHLRPCHVF